MKHIPVDSYGQCLHNKDLPFHLSDSTAMDDESFYQILAQYKFILAFENAICDDYITEKLWRPLKLGVVPVYYGAPNVRMWLPSNRSAIVVDPKQSPEKLAEYIKNLDKNDQEYLTYLDWKLKREISNQRLVKELLERQWGVQDITQDNFIDVFECMVCSRVWENNNRQKEVSVSTVALNSEALWNLSHFSISSSYMLAYCMSSVCVSLLDWMVWCVFLKNTVLSVSENMEM